MRSPQNALITGGAGFIGSHLADRLMQEGYTVAALDNLAQGSLEHLQRWTDHPRFTFIEADLKQRRNLARAIKDRSIIFHLAANPEVRVGETDPQIHFTENLKATFNLLQEIRRKTKVKTLVFASTSTVYGRAFVQPTPETYAPLAPISTYGASKLGCEALISSYAHSIGFHALILRMANIIGPRSNHGVVVDFVKKLKKEPNVLEILGDGTQNKSYMYIEDCIDAIVHLINVRAKQKVEIFNLGSADRIKVRDIADIIVEEMDFSSVQYAFKPGTADGAGWKGDVKNMQLSIRKLVKTGWKPKYTSKQAVRLTTRSLLT